MSEDRWQRCRERFTAQCKAVKELAGDAPRDSRNESLKGESHSREVASGEGTISSQHMSDHAAVKAKELVRDLREGFESNLEQARLTTNSVTGLEAAASAARMRIDDLESAIAAALASQPSDLPTMNPESLPPADLKEFHDFTKSPSCPTCGYSPKMASARCIGYPDCDGDLPGESHSEKCMNARATPSGPKETSVGDLKAKLETLRDEVANGIVSSQMREISGDYDSGATDVEIAVEAALTAIIEGKD